MDDGTKVRAAAERLRPHAGDWRVFPYATAAVDAAVLARAWLAEHPADDGEPVTEEWWDGMGAKRIWPANTNRGFRIGNLAVAANADSLVLWEEPEGRCIGIRIRLNPTRGDVRRLLAALGLA